MLFDKIIYINLDRRPDRNLNVKNQLEKVGLLHMAERFSAIDGKTLDLNNMDPKIITPEGVEYAKKSDILYSHLTIGAIGCAMSHRAIYQKIIDENINSCLILEDDITFDEKFNEKIKQLENELQLHNNNNNFDLFFLGFHPGTSFNFEMYIAKNITKYNTVYGLFGYIVTKKGAKKLLDLFPITYQIDTEISKNTNKIDIYGVNVSNKIILSDQSQYSYQFGTDIQVKKNNDEVNGGVNDEVNGGVNCLNSLLYFILAIIIILCIIVVIFTKND
jgi:glycosyl transferase family 25